MKRKIALYICTVLLCIGFIMAFRSAEDAVQVGALGDYCGSSVTELLRYLLR